MLSRGLPTPNNATHCTPPRLPRFFILGSSVLDRYTIEIVAFELLAGGVGGRFVEAGETGAIERLVALEYALGERIGGCEPVAGFAPRRAQMLLVRVFTGISADLDQPAAAGANLCRRFGLCGLGFDRLGAGRRSGRDFGLWDFRLWDFRLGDFSLGDVRLGSLGLNGVGLDRRDRDWRHSVGRGNDNAWRLRLRRRRRH